VNHILTAEQFSHVDLERLFTKADKFRKSDQTSAGRRKVMQRHTDRIMLSMFFEPSTRTRFSFEIAATKLGIGIVSTENAAEFSSIVKGESIEDMVKVFNEYGIDAISIRTKEEGHAARAASVSKATIINCGDGKGEHPTQSVLDMYTIHEQFKRLDNLRVVIGGDLAHGRTARSLSIMLSQFPGTEIIFVSSPELRIGDDIKARLNEDGTVFKETSEMHGALRNADVVYWTRSQLERHEKKLKFDQDAFVLDVAALDVMPKSAIIMHPLPRNHEIPASTDSDPRAKYFRQAGYEWAFIAISSFT